MIQIIGNQEQTEKCHRKKLTAIMQVLQSAGHMLHSVAPLVDDHKAPEEQNSVGG